jgi:hypothetical protein
VSEAPLPQRLPGASSVPDDVPETVEAPPQPVGNGRARHASREDSADDTIYQKMLSEWLVDPHELSHSTDLNWQSVWDHGWSAAAAAATTPVQDHTAEGLPVRQPGARLVPGAADAGPEEDDERGVSSAVQPGGAHRFPTRDPEAVRASIGSHFGGAHAGRSRARESGGTDTQ